jgi:hypothetical protein
MEGKQSGSDSVGFLYFYIGRLSMVIIKPLDVGGKMNFLRGFLWATGGCPGF